ncbi:MAG: GNAT family N-acetyltransferase [Prevotellaceae bacterium]|nr:GNAT family N-acetyltransferase [Prevotellaceae bacterium]
MFEIKRYNQTYKDEWNEFVKQSKNGTFLFDRDYMDYHQDRFLDCSLMFFKDSKLYALLPANIKESTLYSHQGLTYGGLITGTNATSADIIVLFEELNAYLKGKGISRVVYKAIPWIYAKLPSEEDLYAIFRTCEARLSVREISSTISLKEPLKWSRDRKYGINRCKNNNVTVEKSDDYAAFWKVLEDNLLSTHGVKPVHSLEEILLLKSRFPENIQLYVARKGGIVLGGTLLYINRQVVHSQYISASKEGKALRVIDAIYNVILNEDYRNYPYFDFGKSTEDGGKYLNESLIYQKEGFGGRGVCYDTYEWTL